MNIFTQYYYIWAIFIAMPFFLWFAIKSFRTAGLASKFAKIGDMTGKTYTEIQNFVGRTPSDITKKVDKDGKLLKIVTWSAPGYTIMILFDEKDVFNHIVSESTN